MGASKSKRREYQQKYKNDGRARWYQVKCRYGLSEKDFYDLLSAQDGRCAVCGNDFSDRRHYIDHAHDNDKVRGIVHMECNTLMGLARDNPDLLERAAEYLRRHAK